MSLVMIVMLNVGVIVMKSLVMIVMLNVCVIVDICSIPRTEIKKKNHMQQMDRNISKKEVWTWQDFPKSQTIWMFLTLDVNTFQWI